MTQLKANKSVNSILAALCIFAVLAAAIVLSTKGKDAVNNSASLEPIPTGYQHQKQTERPITKTSSKKGWVTYVNSAYGYQLEVPSGSLLIEEDSNYVRVQNYSFTTDVPGLQKGDYYLEISMNQSGSTGSYSCKDELATSTSVVVNGITGYKGNLQPGGGESAPIRYALCIEKDSMNFNVIASEDVSSVSREIVNSFRFIN